MTITRVVFNRPHIQAHQSISARLCNKASRFTQSWMRCPCKPKLNGYRDHLPGLKRPERKAEFSHASSGEVKNAWSYTYTSTHIRMADLIFGTSLKPVTTAVCCTHQNAHTTATEPPNPTSLCTVQIRNFTGILFLQIIPKPRKQSLPPYTHRPVCLCPF